MDMFISEEYMVRRRRERLAMAFRHEVDQERPARRKEEVALERGNMSTKIRVAIRCSGKEEDIVLNCFTP